MRNKIRKILSLVLIMIMLTAFVPLGAIDFASTARAADLPAYSAGEVITFGSYPQSKVTDSTIIASLDAIGKTWVSYGYYSGTGNSEDGNMKPSDYMKYADVTYNGNKYRAVTFSALRPYKTGYTSSDGSFQDDNGYSAGNVYYFKYEPLTWKVLDPDEGFVMSTKAIDSQAYQNFVYASIDSTTGCTEYYNSKDKTNYASDWATSSVRKWLNEDFFNTAFTSAEKSQIGATYNENKSTASPQYDGINTYDKIFLLTHDDTVNADYGFSKNSSVQDTARRIEPTDYAMCQGCHKDTDAYTDPGMSYSYDGESCDWILRTPFAAYLSFSASICGVLSIGETADSHGVDRTDKGIVPAFKFNPEAASEQPWTVSISSTENFATSQTVTVLLETPGEVSGYFWGTDPDYSKNDFYSANSKTISITVTAGGKYYFTAKGVSGSVSQTEDITFYRTDFNANGGSVSQAYVVSKNGCQIVLPKPTKSGSTFVEWNTKANGTGLPLKSTYIPNGEDTTLYAIWRQDSATYTVTYNANGGNVSPASATVESGKSVTLPTPVRSGYTCLGWALSSSATSASYSCGASYTPNAGTTFYAVWKRNDTTNPTGSISSTNNVAASQTVTLSLSDNEGVAGYYWGTSSVYSSNAYTATGGSNVMKAISSSGTYYLTVKDTSGNVSSNYSITFYKTTLNANGGSVSPTSVLTKSGNSFIFPTPTGKSGYTYSGWSTSSTATSGVTSLTPIADSTYYAVWKYNDTTKPTGAISATNKVETSQTVTLSLFDNVGVAGYYWGTSSTYSSNTYTATTASSVTQSVTSAGTYYLTVKDTSGNISSNYSITFYKTTLNANGGSVSPSYILTREGCTFVFPTPTGKSGYTYSGWSTSSTATSGITSLTITANATYYAVWKQDINYYNLGEETYNFINYTSCKNGSCNKSGHCFGMSSTSSGYYLGILDVSAIGITSSQKLNTVSLSDKVKLPICKYQKIQGGFSLAAVVAGGTYYKTGKNNISSDWTEVINYVKSHEYDNKGLLQIGFRCSAYGGHAINFIRYEVVNGQERIYAYDNNFPNTETYFYKNSSGKIVQTPKSTFPGTIDCMALRYMPTYFSVAEYYDETRFIYAEKDTIRVENCVSEYPMECGAEIGEYVMFEISDSDNQAIIVPLVDNAEFEYLDETYSMGAAPDDTFGILTLAGSGDDETYGTPELVLSKKATVSVNDMEIKYKTDAKFIPEISIADGVKYTVEYSSSDPSVAVVDKDGNVTTLHKGETTITCKVTDEYGNVSKDTAKLTVKFQWWQWLIWILLFGFLWY